MTVTLRETAYAKFRESLYSQELKAGQFVSQKELSTLLAVSYTHLTLPTILLV